MNLQIALDLTSSKEALEIAKEVAESADVVEAGTPLIKSEGISAVEKLNELFPHKLISADMKTADIGEIEVEMAARAGAELITVLGVSPTEVIEAAVNKAWEIGSIKVVVDLLGVHNYKKKINELSKLKIDYLLIHAGVDEQKSGIDVYKRAEAVAKITNIPLIVAGGVNEDNIEKIAKIENVDIVVVGSAIVNAENPAEMARRMKAIIKNA